MQRRIFMALPGLVALAGLGLADSAIAGRKDRYRRRRHLADRPLFRAGGPNAQFRQIVY